MKQRLGGSAGGEHADAVTVTHRAPTFDIISEITASLATEDNLEALLERFLSPLVKLAGATAGAVRALTDDNQHMRLVGALGLPADFLLHERLVGLDCGVCGSAVRTDRVLWATDLRACAEHTPCDFFGQGCSRVLAVPLRYRGRVLGVYNLFFKVDRAIAPEVASLFRSIGELLGLALENARLSRTNLRVTVMNERQMMANEVHDSLAQTLAYMKMRMSLLQDAMLQHDELRSFKYMGDVNQALGSAYSSLREILTHFRNRMDPQGLVHAFQATVDDFHSKTGIQLDFVNHAPDLDLTLDQEVQVFHIVQEALANITKHSHARHARLVLDKQDWRYEITIADDGAGITGGAPLAGEASHGQASHLGMQIMRERAEHLAGHIEVESSAGEGTRVRLSFPATGPRREATL